MAGAAITKKKIRMTGEERRGQIVRVATELFARDGFKGTTTREIARKAGVSEAVIFKHFSRKQALYNAIIDSRCGDSGGQSRLIGRIKDKKGKEVFETIAEYLISEHQKDPSFMRLLTYSALEKHELSEIFIRTKGLELIELLETSIKELARAGTFREIDPAIAARAFIGMILHYSISQELYGLKRYFKRPNEAVVESFVEIFFEGMMRR